MKQLGELHAEIFYPRFVREDQLDRYNAVFDLWNQVWIETRLEVNPLLPTPSDNFGRQDEVIALFHGTSPIATVCSRYVDIRYSWVIHDSFFNNGQWPEEVKRSLPELGRTFAIASHAFVRREFRKQASGLPIKNIVCAMSFLQANASGSDVFLAMMRKDKGMHDLIYRCGGVSLFQDTSFFHIPVDLVAAFPAKKPILIEPELQEVIENLQRGCARLGRSFFEEFPKSSNHPAGGKSYEVGYSKPVRRAG